MNDDNHYIGIPKKLILKPVCFIHRVPKNVTTFSTITNNKCAITIIFGIVSGKSMCHQMMVSFPTSPI